MSLNYCDQSATQWNYLYLYIYWGVMKRNEPWLLPLTREWMNGRILCRLVSLLGHWSPEIMFGNTLWRPKANPTDCTVYPAPNDLSVGVTALLVLSPRPSIRLDAMIFQIICQRCACTSPPFTVQQDECAGNGMAAVAGFLPILLFGQGHMDESVRSPIRWQWVCNILKQRCSIVSLIRHGQRIRRIGVCSIHGTVRHVRLTSHIIPHPDMKLCKELDGSHFSVTVIFQQLPYDVEPVSLSERAYRSTVYITLTCIRVASWKHWSMPLKG